MDCRNTKPIHDANFVKDNRGNIIESTHTKLALEKLRSQTDNCL